MAGKVGLAVYGLGKEGASRLGALLGANERLQLRWVVDKDPAAAQKMLSKALPSSQQPEVMKPWHWDQLCKDKELDGIVICSTLPGVNMIRKSLISGKAVMCEHPISLQQEAVKACYEAAYRTNTPLLFAFKRRFDSMIDIIRSRVQNGAIGSIYSIRSAACYCPLDTTGPRDQDAIFRDCVAEEIDAITWILNESPHTVFATGSGLACNAKTENPVDAVAMTMRFPSGTLATMDVKKADCSHDTHLEINGSRGVLMVDPHHPRGTAIHTINSSGTKTEMLTSSLEDRHAQAFTSAMHHFIDVLQGKSGVQLTELDTLRATDIAAACLQSHLSNAAVARETERVCTPPELLVKEPLWDECPNSYNGVMPPIPVAQ